VTLSDADTPAVRCLACAFEWHSPLMADGLRLLGSCAKCGGELEFADAPPAEDTAAAPAADARAPHLVLGVPRR
jgi:hypothetical protein